MGMAGSVLLKGRNLHMNALPGVMMNAKSTEVTVDHFKITSLENELMHYIVITNVGSGMGGAAGEWRG